MSEADLIDLVAPHFPGDAIKAHGDGRHFNIQVISDQFVGLNTLKRQQMVLSIANQAIVTGKLHALNIQALTLDELAAKHG